eukprot:scaffold11674_cov85-Cylindrotheca_fusiformis.AAC.2
MPKVNKSGSPDSIPSLADTSYASSQEGEDIARVLFFHSEETGQEVVANLGLARDDIGEAAGSVTSSEATKVAAHNLSAPLAGSRHRVFHLLDDESSIVHHSDDDDDDEERREDDKLGAFPTPKKSNTSGKERKKIFPLDEADKDTPKKQQYFFMEDPPTNFASCNKAALAMTPKQLSEIFNSFEGKKTIFSMRSGSSEPMDKSVSPFPELEAARSTASRWMDGWMPQNTDASFEKECETLKEVLEDKSDKLLDLREAVETQRSLNALKEVEIEDKEKELQRTRREMDVLRREKESFREREQELLETIKILNCEIDVLTTRYNEESAREDSMAEEASRITDESTIGQHFENALSEVKYPQASFLEMEPFDEALDLHSKVREQEELISNLQKQVEEKDAQCHQLQQDLADARKEFEQYWESDETASHVSSVHSTSFLGDEMKLGSENCSIDDQGQRDVLSPRPPSGLVAELRKTLEKREQRNQLLAEIQEVQSRHLSDFGEAHVADVVAGCPTTKDGPEENQPINSFSETDSVPVIPTSEADAVRATGQSSAELMEIIANLSQRLEAMEAASQRDSSSAKSSISETRAGETERMPNRLVDKVPEPRDFLCEGEKEPDPIVSMMQGQQPPNNRPTGTAVPNDQKQNCCCWSDSITGDLE